MQVNFLKDVPYLLHFLVGIRLSNVQTEDQMDTADMDICTI